MENEINGKPSECSACGYATSDLYPSKQRKQDGTEFYYWFCDLCGSTHSASAKIYPSNQRDVGDVLYAICFVGNKILSEVQKSELRNAAKNYARLKNGIEIALPYGWEFGKKFTISGINKIHPEVEENQMNDDYARGIANVDTLNGVFKEFISPLAEAQDKKNLGL